MYCRLTGLVLTSPPKRNPLSGYRRPLCFRPPYDLMCMLTGNNSGHRDGSDDGSDDNDSGLWRGRCWDDEQTRQAKCGRIHQAVAFDRSGTKARSEQRVRFGVQVWAELRAPRTRVGKSGGLRGRARCGLQFFRDRVRRRGLRPRTDGRREFRSPSGGRPVGRTGARSCPQSRRLLARQFADRRRLRPVARPPNRCRRLRLNVQHGFVHGSMYEFVRI